MEIELSVMIEPVSQASPVEPVCVDPLFTLGRVLELLKDRESTGVLICRGSKLLGIFTERDALNAMVDRRSLSTPISAVMSPAPVTVHPETTIGVAIRRMCDGGYRRLPIVDSDNQPVGIVQLPGIMRFLVDRFPCTIDPRSRTSQRSIQRRKDR